ncbi:adenosylcobinamide-GDP ribazoletransferase [Alkalithermobacter paradoxus]|uniref:Adenosylcobinamide-GDP ribazoletransferase n=1 Tax=Alkalithermobacter paradoxus TaxID=29349 RepID=A0A1V4I7C6_9FIRM|nr:cobalamin synthase [[Clostridium] thermoalcaliphilum]
MRRFLGILQFLTRIPISANLGFDEEFHKGVVYFPFIGLILGSLYLIFTYTSIKIFGYYIGTVAFLLSEVLLTGGLHLDGLGDTFDGIYSYKDKDKILEIMKDSRLGTNGLLSILFLILLKIGFVFMLISRGIYYPLIVCPIVGRLSISFACYKTKSPRPSGMGNSFIGKVDLGQISKCIFQTIFFMVVIGYIFKNAFSLIVINIMFIPILWIFVKLYTKYITRIIGGITGDILGSICEISQLIYFVFICLEVGAW